MNLWTVLGLIAAGLGAWRLVRARTRGHADSLPHYPEMSTLSFPPEPRRTTPL